MPTLLQIAKRQVRAGKDKYEINDILNLADALEIDKLEPGAIVASIVERAEKETSKETRAARKASLRLFIDNIEENTSTRRDLLFDSVVQTISAKHPDWEPVFVGNIVAGARNDFDLAVAGQPIERVKGYHDQLPLCQTCGVSKAGDKYLDIAESLEIIPQCWDCFRDAQQKVLNGC